MMASRIGHSVPPSQQRAARAMLNSSSRDKQYYCLFVLLKKVITKITKPSRFIPLSHVFSLVSYCDGYLHKKDKRSYTFIQGNGIRTMQPQQKMYTLQKSVRTTCIFVPVRSIFLTYKVPLSYNLHTTYVLTHMHCIYIKNLTKTLYYRNVQIPLQLISNSFLSLHNSPIVSVVQFKYFIVLKTCNCYHCKEIVGPRAVRIKKERKSASTQTNSPLKE